MTQEEKELLLKDLCARIPYRPIVEIEEGLTIDLWSIDEEGINRCFSFRDYPTPKPYLKPMSSMTEEENKEFAKVMVRSQDCSYKNSESATTMVNDWYLSKGFDVRGLIPKGLAIEAPENMYNIREK